MGGSGHGAVGGAGLVGELWVGEWGEQAGVGIGQDLGWVRDESEWGLGTGAWDGSCLPLPY